MPAWTSAQYNVLLPRLKVTLEVGMILVLTVPITDTTSEVALPSLTLPCRFVSPDTDRLAIDNPPVETLVELIVVLTVELPIDNTLVDNETFEPTDTSEVVTAVELTTELTVELPIVSSALTVVLPSVAVLATVNTPLTVTSPLAVIAPPTFAVEDTLIKPVMFVLPDVTSPSTLIDVELITVLIVELPTTIVLPSITRSGPIEICVPRRAILPA